MIYVRAFLAGVIGAIFGAVLGVAVSTIIVPLLGITGFEGGSGLFAFFVCAPIGAAIGFIVGAIILLRRQRLRSPATLAGHLAVVVGVTGAVLGGVYWYLFVKQDPVNPNGPTPQLAFEIRLPAGATLPPLPKQVEVYLDASGRRSAARLLFEQFRRDGDRPVIVGAVEMYYRSDHRLLLLNRPGEIGRIFHILLPVAPQHAEEFGTWEQVRYLDTTIEGRPAFARNDDTHEIRYRTIWPKQGIKLD